MKITDKDKKAYLMAALLIIIMIGVPIIAVNAYNSSNAYVRENSYMATQLIYSTIVRIYWDHVNYSHGVNKSSFDYKYERTSTRELLNFSISVLENVSKRCSEFGWAHAGLDKNIKAYIALRNFLVKNWGNYKKVIPVTGYLRENFSSRVYTGFLTEQEAAESYNYNEDHSQAIYAALKK